MNTITVGQQHYRWQVDAYAWLKAAECTIYNLVDPAAQLSIVLPTTNTSYCTPKQIKVWIDTALQQGWYSERQRYRLTTRNRSPYLLPIASSLGEEQQLVQKIKQQYSHRTLPTALEKSNISAQWQELEQQLGYKLPTALQQIYLELGNGHFGPDYGFFLLETETSSDKLTLWEAYQEVQGAKIADWDWQLPPQSIPFLYWGADIYSIVDVSHSKYPVYVLDMNLKKTHNTWRECYWQHCASFFEWLEKWTEDQASGRSLWLEMYQLRGLL